MAGVLDCNEEEDDYTMHLCSPGIISDDVLWSCYNTSVASVGLSLALVSFIITFNRQPCFGGR